MEASLECENLKSFWSNICNSRNPAQLSRHFIEFVGSSTHFSVQYFDLFCHWFSWIYLPSPSACLVSPVILLLIPFLVEYFNIDVSGDADHDAFLNLSLIETGQSIFPRALNRTISEPMESVSYHPHSQTWRSLITYKLACFLHFQPIMVRLLCWAHIPLSSPSSNGQQGSITYC